MLRKDDVVYYKVVLNELFKQAKGNGLIVELGMKEVSFINPINNERASAKPE